MTFPNRRDFRLDKYNNNKPKKDFPGQARHSTVQTINTVFREPVTKVFIASIIKTVGTLRKIAELYEITSSN